MGDDGCAVFCRPTGLTNEKFPDYHALFAPGASVLVLNAVKSFTVNHFAIGFFLYSILFNCLVFTRFFDVITQFIRFCNLQKTRGF